MEMLSYNCEKKCFDEVFLIVNPDGKSFYITDEVLKKLDAKQYQDSKVITFNRFRACRGATISHVIEVHNFENLFYQKTNKEDGCNEYQCKKDLEYIIHSIYEIFKDNPNADEILKNKEKISIINISEIVSKYVLIKLAFDANKRKEKKCI